MLEPDSTSCRYARGRLALLCGDDLPQGESAVVRQHLADCLSCRNEFGAYLRPQRALQRLAPTDHDRPFDEQFFVQLGQTIGERLHAEPTPAWMWAARRAGHTPKSRWRWVGGLAAAALLLALGFALAPGGMDGSGRQSLLERPPLQGTPMTWHGPDARTVPVGAPGLLGQEYAIRLIPGLDPQILDPEIPEDESWEYPAAVPADPADIAGHR